VVVAGVAVVVAVVAAQVVAAVMWAAPALLSVSIHLQ
jgi:hypothetical protein